MDDTTATDTCPTVDDTPVDTATHAPVYDTTPIPVDDTEMYDTEEDATPGFGSIVAFAGLIAVAYLVRRR